MEELGHISHDRLLIRPLNIHILGVQQSGDPKLFVSNLENVLWKIFQIFYKWTYHESSLQADEVALMAH